MEYQKTQNFMLNLNFIFTVQKYVPKKLSEKTKEKM
jgi:hypothetical protein